MNKVAISTIAGLVLAGILVGGFWYFNRPPDEETQLMMRVYDTTDVGAMNRLREMGRQLDENKPFTDSQIDFLIEHVRSNRENALAAYGFLANFPDNPYRREERIALLKEAASAKPPIIGTKASLLGLVRMKDPEARTLVEQALRDPAFSDEWDHNFLRNMLAEIDQGPEVWRRPPSTQ